ncbi:MAG: hypothetical protein ABIJ92_00010 [Candidatus Aenigmatarchaeota archaeon]
MKVTITTEKKDLTFLVIAVIIVASVGFVIATNPSPELTANVIADKISFQSAPGFEHYDTFEVDFGNWTNVAGDDFDWTRFSGSTPSGQTGPTSAYEGTWYIYTEASSNNPSRTAIVESPVIDFDSYLSEQIKFRYHAYGSNGGMIYLEVQDGVGGWTTLWSTSIGISNVWQVYTQDLSTQTGSSKKLRFRVVTGTDYLSDFALDAINISSVGIDPFCGDGTQDPGEECDDGCLVGTPNVCEVGIDDGDGCSYTCTIEVGASGNDPDPTLPTHPWDQVYCTDCITAGNIETGAVGALEIASSAVGQSELQANSVDSSKIVDNSIGSADIGTGAVGTDEIADGSIQADDIAAGAIPSNSNCQVYSFQSVNLAFLTIPFADIQNICTFDNTFSEGYLCDVKILSQHQGDPDAILQMSGEGLMAFDGSPKNEFRAYYNNMLNPDILPTTFATNGDGIVSIILGFHDSGDVCELDDGEAVGTDANRDISLVVQSGIATPLDCKIKICG